MALDHAKALERIQQIQSFCWKTDRKDKLWNRDQVML